MAIDYRRLIELLDFGYDVAENDVELNKYFVETENFNEIVSGKVDIIRGHKGIGKSAIFRMLSTGEYSIDGVSIIASSDATSSQIFKPTKSQTLSEDQYRLLWCAYLSSLIVNETLRNFSGDIEVIDELSDLNDLASIFGTRREKRKGKLLDKVLNTKSVGFSLGVGADGAPNISCNLDFHEGGRQVELSEDQFMEMIATCVMIHQQKKRELWVLLDRLDEQYEKNSDNEKNSIRSLLRVHQTICSLEGGQTTIRPKIFLRTDIFRTITRDSGFANLTHFRVLDLIWGRRSIFNLVITRVVANPEIRKMLQDLRIGVRDINEVWDCLVPDKIQGFKSDQWFVTSTADSKGAFNPRNVIALLSVAAKREKERVRTYSPDHQFISVLSPETIIPAHGEISRRRLEDTVLAEYPGARPYIERLSGGPANFESRRDFQEQLGDLASSEEALDEAITTLHDIGILKIITDNSFGIAFLYRPALRTGNKKRTANR